MNLRELFDALVVRGPFRNVTQTNFVSLLRGLRDLHLVEQTPDGLMILGLEGETITADRCTYTTKNGFGRLQGFYTRKRIDVPCRFGVLA